MKLFVEGYEVLVRKGKNSFVITVPELPGVVGQVEKAEDARKEIRKLILAHARALADKKP